VTVLCFVSPNFCLADAPSIFIDEVMWRGSSVSTADEFIELYNGFAQVVDISGYEIFDEVTQKSMVRIIDGQIAPSGHFLIANNSKDYEFSKGKSVSDIDPDLIDSDVSLNNTKFKISLRDKSGQVVDVAGSGGVPFYGQYLDQIASMQRINYSSSGDLPDAWRASEMAYNLDEGALDYATPENSGRPRIDNFDLSSYGYEIQANLLVVADFEITDSKNDFDRIEILVENSPDKLVFSFPSDESVFDLGKFDYCPTLVFSFADKSGLSASIKKALVCFRPVVGVGLNEIMFRPKSIDWNQDQKFDLKDEWIELKNSGLEDADLSGFLVEDLSGKQYKLLGTISVGGFLVVYGLESGISLNDTGETLFLKNPSGEVIDQIEIPKNELYDVSFSKFDDRWKFTKSATPAIENIYQDIVEKKIPEISNPIQAPNQLQIPSPALPVASHAEEQVVSEIVVAVYTTKVTTPPIELPDIKLDKITFPQVKGSSVSPSAQASNYGRFLVYSFSVLTFVSLIFLYEFYHRE